MSARATTATHAVVEAPWDAGAGAFTPHYGVEFVATTNIVQGMELVSITHLGTHVVTRFHISSGVFLILFVLFIML